MMCLHFVRPRALLTNHVTTDSVTSLIGPIIRLKILSMKAKQQSPLKYQKKIVGDPPKRTIPA